MKDNKGEFRRLYGVCYAPYYCESHMMSIKGTYGDPDLINKLGTFRMPFGKHSKTLLIDLPSKYLVWFSKSGFPQGELGRLMRIVYDIKTTGMEHLFDGIRSIQATPDSIDNK